MNTNTAYEQDVDLKDLIFFILHKWRIIILVSFFFAVVIGGVKLIMTYRTQSSSEYRQELYENYNGNIELHASNTTMYEREIDNLLNDIAKQQEYLEKSILMNTSPYDVSEAYADIFVKTDYEIMPGMMYQNSDYTDTILQAYQSTLTSNAFLNDIAQTAGIPTQYLQELISVDRRSIEFEDGYANKFTNLFTIKVKHTDVVEAEAILNSILSKCEKLQTQIMHSIGEHTISIVNNSSGTRVDLELAELQKSESKRLADLQTAFTNKEMSLKELKEPVEPVSALTSSIKQGVKYALLSGVFFVFTLFFLFAILFLISDKLYSAKDIRKHFGLKILGVVSSSRPRWLSFVDKWITQLEGYNNNLKEEKAYTLIAANIQNYTPAANTLLLTGAVTDDQLFLIKKNLDCELDGITIITGGNMFKTPETLSQLPTCDGIILVEQTQVSLLNTIAEEIEIAGNLSKEIVGCIVLT